MTGEMKRRRTTAEGLSGDCPLGGLTFLPHMGVVCHEGQRKKIADGTNGLTDGQVGGVREAQKGCGQVVCAVLPQAGRPNRNESVCLQMSNGMPPYWEGDNMGERPSRSDSARLCARGGSWQRTHMRV